MLLSVRERNQSLSIGVLSSIHMSVRLHYCHSHGGFNQHHRPQSANVGDGSQLQAARVMVPIARS